MIAVCIEMTMIGITINIYRHSNKYVLIENFNSTILNSVCSFAGHYTGRVIFIVVAISTINFIHFMFAINIMFAVIVTTAVSL